MISHSDIENGRALVNGIEVRFMPPSALLLRKPLQYVDSFHLLPLLQRICFDPITTDFDPPNLLLKGPKGVGKTLLFQHWSQSQSLPYVSLNCSLESKDRYTKGGFVVLPENQGGGMAYVLGKLSNAVLIANSTGAAMLVFEELNALPPEQQKNLNSLTDFRQEIEIPELGWNLALQPDASLLVAGTMNNSGGGIYELNEDLQSRFLSLDVGYPSQDTEKEVLRTNLSPGSTITDQELDTLIRIAQQTRQETTSYALSPRDLVQLVKVVQRAGWQEAMFLAAQKFSPEDRKLVAERIQDITKISVWPTAVERAAEVTMFRGRR